jgi:hypothetical protein
MIEILIIAPAMTLRASLTLSAPPQKPIQRDTRMSCCGNRRYCFFNRLPSNATPSAKFFWKSEGAHRLGDGSSRHRWENSDHERRRGTDTVSRKDDQILDVERVHRDDEVSHHACLSEPDALTSSARCSGQYSPRWWPSWSSAFFSFPRNQKPGFTPPTPLRLSYPKRPVHRHRGVLTFGSLAIGDGTTTDTNGFLAITNALPWGPTDGFTATGFSTTVDGSGSKAIGVIEQPEFRLKR